MNRCFVCCGRYLSALIRISSIITSIMKRRTTALPSSSRTDVILPVSKKTRGGGSKKDEIIQDILVHDEESFPNDKKTKIPGSSEKPESETDQEPLIVISKDPVEASIQPIG